MILTNMKNDGDDNYGSMPDTARNYSGGLCLYLDDDQCEKLGITNALPAGTAIRIEAQAIVTTASESVDSDGDGGANDISLSLQITDLGIEPVGMAANAADQLYGKS